MRLLLEVLILSLFAAALVYGQFTSGTNLVEVYATVTDRQGGLVTGLIASDFKVTEDGTPQAITAFAAGEFPLSVVIALDRSFSMAGAPLTAAKDAARAFIGALRPDDQVMVLAIGSEIETVVPPAPATAAAAARLDGIEPWGSTPLYDAIARSLDLPHTQRRRRALLILSDGFDRDSQTSAGDLIDRARRAGVLAYPVAMGKTRPPVFAELATVTGGRSLFVEDPAQLAPALVAIARELRLQYLLGYVPRPDAPGWHAIDVSVSRPGARVRARDGYFAP